MVRTTPIGTRTCAISRPFGRRQAAMLSPTGSGRAAISSRPRAIASMRAGVSVSRSMNAAASPAARARATSLALASSSAASAPRSPAAAARRAGSLAGVDAPASGRAAWRASGERTSTACSTAGERAACIDADSKPAPGAVPPAPAASARGSGVRDDDEIVAVDDLVAALVAEEPRDVTAVRALDALDLRRRVVHQAARHLAAVRSDAAHAVADAERALDRTHARWQEAAASLRERALGSGVEVERPRGPQRVRDPVLAVRKGVALRQQQRADLELRIEGSAQNAASRPVGDERRDAGARRRTGGGDLRGHPAGADAGARRPCGLDAAG